ncbi:MAG: tetratricopeptide repeat protein [Alphaproteobacteria bacterium]|nr:tetratricopeptide repeat protein [Alphaproteobacteria bacterium]
MRNSVISADDGGRWSRLPRLGLWAAAALCWLGFGCVAPDTAQREPVVEEEPASEPAAADTVVVPTSALGGYLAGRFARARHDSTAAIRFFGRALESDPANPELMRRTLTALIADRRVADAQDVALALARSDTESPIALLALATEAIGRADFQGAETWLEAAPKVGFNRYLAPLLSAWTRLGQGTDADPLAVLEALSDVSAFAAMRDYHDALIADLLDMTARAESGYIGAIGSVRGGSLRVVQAAGAFYERHGRGEEAGALYEGYLEENPDSTLIEHEVRRLETGAPAERLVTNPADGFAEALYGVAMSLFQEKAYEPALVYTQFALYLRPELDAALLLLGDILSAIEQPERAVAAYRQVPASSPLSWSVRLRLTTVLDRLGDIAGAADELRAMAVERPERADPLVSLGEILRARERYEEAVAAYDQAISRIPSLENRHWILLYARGMSLERSDQWPRAEADFLHALELEPDQPLVLNYLGYSWVELGMKLDRARGMIERAVAQRPNDGYIVDSLGWVFYQTGQYESALPHLERAVELRPGDPVITDHFGDALWQVGRREEAEFQWRRALSFDPEPELFRRVKDKIAGGVPEPPSPGEDL